MSVTDPGRFDTPRKYLGGRFSDPVSPAHLPDLREVAKLEEEIRRDGLDREGRARRARKVLGVSETTYYGLLSRVRQNPRVGVYHAALVHDLQKEWEEREARRRPMEDLAPTLFDKHVEGLPPVIRHDGDTYEPDKDAPRLGHQAKAVFNLMHDGEWRNLAEIAEATGYPEASVSARLRDLRKRKFGANKVERRRVVNTFFYRLEMAPKFTPDDGTVSLEVVALSALFLGILYLAVHVGIWLF